MSSKKTHNLDDEDSSGNEDSLRALIRSIVPDAATNSNGKYSADIVDTLAAKLTELMGPDAFQDAASRQQQLQQARMNDKGEFISADAAALSLELVNEEGLPIIDINEPAGAETATQFQYTASRPAPITVEPLLPLATLPQTAREQLRARRERILDQLEEEERMAERAEAQREEDERREAAAKRKRAEEELRSGAAAEKARAARELQKKMGRALIQNVGKAKEQERAEQEAQRMRDEEADKRKASPNIKKKTVAFVDSPEAKLKDDNDADADDEASSSSSKVMDWGDVAPARLRSNKRPTLMTQSLLDKHPMKMQVVERIPGGTPTISKTQAKAPSTPTPTSIPSASSPRPVDSDDESEPEEPSDSDSATEVDNEGDGDGEGEEDTALDEDAVDLDYAAMQREIALEYYQKRNQIGEAAASAMMNHTHDEDERIATEPELVHDTASKPAISQFRANKLAEAYNMSTHPSSSRSPSTSTSTPTPSSTSTSTSTPTTTSTSLGASVLPASSTRTIQKAIRTGKLDDDGRLVGGEDDSASEEEDQGIQEVLELLRKGEVYNLGPDGTYVHAVRPGRNVNVTGNVTGNARSGLSTAAVEPPSTTSGSAPSVPVPGPSSTPATGDAPSLPPPTVRSKTSKFKADRAAAGRPTPGPSSLSFAPPNPHTDVRSPSVTPISHAGRSSPKMDAPPPLSAPGSAPVTVPAPVPVRTASPSPSASAVASTSSYAKSPVPVPTRAPAQAAPTPTLGPASASPFSMIVESPSFPHMSMGRGGGGYGPSVSRAQDHPYDSELAAIYAGTTEGAAGGAGGRAPGQPRRPVRPPPVIASSVLERKKPAGAAPAVASGAEAPQQEKKVSRFMAGRK